MGRIPKRESKKQGQGFRRRLLDHDIMMDAMHVGAMVTIGATTTRQSSKYTPLYVVHGELPYTSSMGTIESREGPSKPRDFDSAFQRLVQQYFLRALHTSMKDLCRLIVEKFAYR